MQQLLRVWLAGTVIVIVAMLVWAFAPILVPVALIGGGLAVPVTAAIGAARWLERRRGGRAVSPDEAG